MNKKILFGLIGAIFATGAFGEATTQTVTTQNYVDTNFQTKIPAKSVTWSYGNNTNTVPSVITATDTAGMVDQRGIYNYEYEYYADLLQLDPNIEHYLPEMGTLNGALEYISDDWGAGHLAAANSGAEKHWILVPDNSKVGFKHIVTVNSVDYLGTTLDPTQAVPTMKAMEEKQNKMTCTRWLDTPENPDHTDENCLLWELSN